MIDWIRENLPDSELPRLQQTLIEWCDINSGSLNLEGLELMRTRLEREFSPLAESSATIDLPTCRRRDEYGEFFDLHLGKALHFQTRPDAPLQILFSGHYDTIYGSDDAFQKCTLSPDKKILNGPGVADMKGGLLVMREAIQLLEQHPDKHSIGWQVVLNPEEEIGTPGARDLLRTAAEKADYGLVFESSTLEGELIQRRLGSGLFVAEVNGRSAHAGRDFDQGRNAIEGLSAFIIELRQIYRKLDGVIINAARFHSAAPLNSVPDKAIAQFNIRAGEPETIEILHNEIKAAQRHIETEYDVTIDWQGQFDRPPRIPDSSVIKMESTLNQCFTDFEAPFGWKDTGGGTDGSLLLDYGLPNIDSLGVRGAYLHSDRECMAVESLLERIRVTTLFLLRSIDKV